MVDRFTKYFSVEPMIIDKSMDKAEVFTTFMNVFEGKDFGKGLYRVHYKNEIDKWNGIISEMYPNYTNGFYCFSYDWLGRHFAVDSKSGHIIMFEPGTADILEIPCDFIEFHEEEIPNYTDACLALEFFKTWRAYNNSYIEHNKCVSYKIPLFLGGADEISNLEISDMEVYWFICTAALNKR
jgi:hypothetical protein